MNILAALLIAAALAPPFPVELPFVLILMRWRWMRPVLLAALLAVLLLRVGDAGMQAAFGRPFDLVTDWPLLGSAWALAGNFVGIALVAAFLAAAFALHWALRQRVPVMPVAALVMVLPVGAGSVGLVAAKWQAVQQTQADLRVFRAAAGADRYADDPALLGGLLGYDAAILFVESYGRASFENPLYARHVETLREAEGHLRDAGLAMRSGWLTSPVVGGQSWLAHGTLLSGLRIADQSRYRALLQGPRKTLVQLAAQAGRDTLAVMPAITRPWPEGAELGFARILDAQRMGYRGKPLDWVTMPDQYTLSVLGRELRAAGDQFAVAALISSHAPWVPVIGMQDWGAVGDGSLFDGIGWDARTPEQIWRDPALVREQYAASLDYALRAVLQFAARQGDDPPLLVILGDHQPAGFVAQGDSRDVPVHVIGPQDLVARIGGWGWTDGLVPDAEVLSWPMETFRDRYLNAFTQEAGYIAN